MNVRIIPLYGWGCYRCSSHSLRDLKGEEVLIFFNTGWKKRLWEYWTNLNEIMMDQIFPDHQITAKNNNLRVTKNVFIHPQNILWEDFFYFQTFNDTQESFTHVHHMSLESGLFRPQQLPQNRVLSTSFLLISLPTGAFSGTHTLLSSEISASKTQQHF